ncbi:hypothetical protein FCULG_00009430 [Fusarium culmorum]|uniref:Uncharacterized protein n=1 Tax=Fusarium culmorum TaxID=5516 RepID=A0A2T4GHC6_FUSCU|nr:hypothetical protein FCULG_00009430 [Fusarium culmorum]
MADLEELWQKSRASTMRHVSPRIPASLIPMRHSPDTKNEDVVQVTLARDDLAWNLTIVQVI